MPKLQIGDKEINYTVRRGKGSKYVYLRFTRNFDLMITLPKNSNLDPEKIIKEKRAWIERKYKQLSERKKVSDGKRVLYKGRYYDLEVIRSNKENVRIDKDKIILHTDERDPKALLKKWMKRKTRDYLNRLMPVYAKKLGTVVNGFKIKNMKKWGYCNKNGKLAFNWQLIALPKELMEYVILHEIAHLSEFNHSKNFRYRLASICPDFMEREIELKNMLPIS